MAANTIKSELKRWGFRFWADNFWGDLKEIKLIKLLDEGELRVHEMLSLSCRWAIADVITEDGESKNAVKFLFATGWKAMVLF